MKSYTDINQSKKLAEILPVESADMTWEQVTNALTKDFTWKPTMGLDSAIKYNLFSYKNGYVLPCWSLAALIEAMPEILIETVKAQDGYDGYYYFVTYEEEEIGVPYKKELVDACYEMILKLHEQKLL